MPCPLYKNDGQQLALPTIKMHCASISWLQIQASCATIANWHCLLYLKQSYAEGAAKHSVRTSHVETLCFSKSLLQCLHTRSLGFAQREGMFRFPAEARYINLY